MKEYKTRERHKYYNYNLEINIFIINIYIKFNISITDTSYMFAECDKIIDINFVSFNIKNIISMKNIFRGYKNLKTH